MTICSLIIIVLSFILLLLIMQLVIHAASNKLKYALQCHSFSAIIFDQWSPYPHIAQMMDW